MNRKIGLAIPIIFLQVVFMLTSCNRHPDRFLILDLEKGEAMVDSQDLVIIEFLLTRIGPIQFRKFQSSISEATTRIQFSPVSKEQFNDSTLEYVDIILDAWAIDTLRNQEYRFYESYETWDEIRTDTTDNFDGVFEPKYINAR